MESSIGINTHEERVMRFTGNYNDPILWLQKNVDGFSALKDDDRRAILNFLLLWSYFEAKNLKPEKRATSSGIIELSRKTTGKIENGVCQFEDILEYFRERYVINGGVTTYFSDLRFPHQKPNHK